MKQLRNCVPVLGLFALLALFLKMPEIPNVFACKSCSSQDPYLPLIGSGYFAALIAIALLFPVFPGRLVARGGLIWAVLLAAVLTYSNLPDWCGICLICHGCHILMWTIWEFVPPAAKDRGALAIRERLCLMLFAPILVIALFSCLNLTFMAYGFKKSRDIMATTLRPGDAVPAFTTKTTGGKSIANTNAAETEGIVINFISPDCPYCKEQLPVVNDVATELASGSYRFINVSPAVPPELVQNSPATEWVEDKQGILRELFKVSGYPTMFVVGNDGKITQIIPSVPEQLKSYLLTSLVKSHGG